MKVLAPDTEVDDNQWESKCSLKLDPNQPGDKSTIIVTVKCDDIETYSSIVPSQGDQILKPQISQSLQAIVTTKYHHKLYAELVEAGKLSECSPMSAILQAKVTTLERPALTMSSSYANLYKDNKAIVNVTVHCNTPVPFKLKDWNITFPAPLVLDQGGDLNSGLFDCSVIEGEELFFGFKCRVNYLDSDVTSTKKCDSAVLNIVLQDHFGKTFLQVLPLDLDLFFRELTNASSLGNSNTAAAKFTLTPREALVGQPVLFRCDIDCSGLKHPNDYSIIYKIDPDVKGDWVIGGKVQGELKYSKDSQACVVEFTGIPTQPGQTKSFPSIKLVTLNGDATSLPMTSQTETIKVNSDYPMSFKTYAHKTIETFAFITPEE